MSVRLERLLPAGRIAIAAWALTTGWVSGCASEDAEGTDGAATTDQSIIHGSASSVAQDAVIMLRIGDHALCSGTLVAPNLVLTARHCVSETDEGIECGADGNAIQGGAVGADRAPDQLVVYTGRRTSSLMEAAHATRIFHDGATNLCNHDLALLLLDRDVTDVTPAPLRLTDSTKAGESVTSVGWGLTTKDTIPSARQQRKQVAILDVGPSEQTASHQMVVGESICSGDSGGPALSQQGAVIGVVSYGGGGGSDADPTRPSASCTGPTARNTYTRIAPFASLIRSAFKLAKHTPSLEPAAR
ncbi:MAG: hypothetical protein JWN04_5991 [Myxococcaceae bacterium]|nr:hypothetical protein [Myxococcaceae bacterium]